MFHPYCAFKLISDVTMIGLVAPYPVLFMSLSSSSNVYYKGSLGKVSNPLFSLGTM